MIQLFLGDSTALMNEGLAPQGDVPPEMKRVGQLRADACVTDPPYGFDFSGGQGKDWDSFADKRSHTTAAEDSEVFAKFTEKWAYACKQHVLKPGSHLLAFTAGRTIGPVDRGLQRAGYAIPRVLFWLYGSGQVKNPNDLRPGCEPIFCGRIITDGNGKPLNDRNLTDMFKKDGLGQLHAQTWKEEDGKHPTDTILDESMLQYEGVSEMVAAHPGTFYVPKPSIKDKDYGCEGLEVSEAFASKLSSGQFSIECHDCHESRKLSFQTKKCPSCKSTNTSLTKIEKLAGDRKNIHPTVKPIDLMRRLIKLVSRPGHTIIDPFMGSGTTGVAAVLEGRHFIGIEREPDYFTIAKARIESAMVDSAKA